MRKFDRDTTNPIIIEDELRFPKGTRNVIKTPMAPAFVAGDFLVSPSGVKGYVGGRSLETPGAWIFIVKEDGSSWGSTVVEMMPDSFVGFKKVEE